MGLTKVKKMFVVVFYHYSIKNIYIIYLLDNRIPGYTNDNPGVIDYISPSVRSPILKAGANMVPAKDKT